MDNFILDVSHYENPNGLDYKVAKANGVTGVYIKATQSNNYQDPLVLKHAQVAKKSGMKIGLYHFCDCNTDGQAQADWFLEVVKQVEDSVGSLDYPLVLDIEPMSDKKIGWNELGLWTRVIRITNMIKKLETVRNSPVMIYTAPSFWTENFGLKASVVALTQGVKFSSRKLWLADYNSKPSVPKPWNDWSMWQYTENEIGKGFKGGCDSSYSKI